MHLKQILIQSAQTLSKLSLFVFLPFILLLSHYSSSSSYSLPPSPPHTPTPLSLFLSLPHTFKHSIPLYWVLTNDTIQVLQHNEMGKAMWRKRLEENGEPSISLPPVNAPHWAVNSEFRNASSFTSMLLL